MTAPNQPPPAGNYIYAYGLDPSGDQSVKHQQTDWTTQTIQSALGAAGGITGSWTNAQNQHNQVVKQPIVDNANQIGTSATTLSGHENRITKLEGGGEIAIFYSNDTWHKPSGYSYHHVYAIGGSGGGQGGQDAGAFQNVSGTFLGGQEGGPGGFQKTDFADADLSLASYSVTIGTGGTGAYSYLSDNFNRANASSLGSNWRTDSGSNVASIISQRANPPVLSGTQISAGAIYYYWSTYTGGNPYTDNYVVQIQIDVPASAAGGEGGAGYYVGLYLAAPSSYSSSSNLVAFTAATAGGNSGIFSMQNAPSAPYNPMNSGFFSNQTIRASGSANVANGDIMSLKRKGNVFTAYINGVLKYSWTDSSNVIPTGANNRYWGFIIGSQIPDDGNGNPLPQKDGPAVVGINMSDLDATAGTDTIFSGGTVTVTGGGGSPGSVYGASGPAAAGAGNQTPTAYGGKGGSSASIPGTAGGNGVNAAGGAGGTNPGDPGHDGTNLPTASYGNGGGGGGGAGSNSTAAEGGQGGNGGFPGAGGGGGGGTPSATKRPGGGGNGTPGYCVVISNNSAT